MSYFNACKSKIDIEKYLDIKDQQCKRCIIYNSSVLLTCPNDFLTNFCQANFNKLDADAQHYFLNLVNKDGCVLFNKFESVLRCMDDVTCENKTVVGVTSKGLERFKKGGE